MPDDLYIQYQNSDAGGAIVPCSDYWLSPSIWLSGAAVDASTAKAGDDPANPATGAFENLINVKVHSKSPNEKTVHVQVWPSNYLIAAAPAGMLPGVPLIGFTGSVDGVRKGAPGQVAIPGWKPKPSDFNAIPGFPPPPSVGPGRVHICLVANCYTTDFEDGGPDGAQITSTNAAFLFCNEGIERHHGQKNILVQKVTPEGKPLMELVIGALNPRAQAQTFTIDITDVPGRLSREHLVFLLQGGHIVHAKEPRPPTGVLAPHDVGPLKGRFALADTDGTVILRRSPLPLRHLEIRSEKKHGAELSLKIAPHRQVPVMIQAVSDPDETPGMCRVLRLRQRDSHNRNMGGADVVLLHVP